MVKPRLQCSISGGRTSARMAIMIKGYLADQYDVAYTFANTSEEDEDTLRFLNEVDTRYNLGVVWLEAVVHYDERKSCTHKIVTYETAKRNGEVFEAVVAKYGLPNKTFQLCTREMKLRTMQSYLRSIGWEKGSYEIALGIRVDEPRRVNRETAEEDRIVYPLADWMPMDKQDVLDYFEPFPWDLRIKEHEGNCVTCFKKSHKKLHRLYLERPQAFDFRIRLDDLYSRVGPNNVPGPRKMYRGYLSTRELIESFADATPRPDSQMDGGCSESCEVYETTEDEQLW